MGKRARTDLDRSGAERHRAEHLHPQGRAQERRTLQCRVRHLQGREGSNQGGEEGVVGLPASPADAIARSTQPCEMPGLVPGISFSPGALIFQNLRILYVNPGRWRYPAEVTL